MRNTHSRSASPVANKDLCRAGYSGNEDYSSHSTGKLKRVSLSAQARASPTCRGRARTSEDKGLPSPTQDCSAGDGGSAPKAASADLQTVVYSDKEKLEDDAVGKQAAGTKSKKLAAHGQAVLSRLSTGASHRKTALSRKDEAADILREQICEIFWSTAIKFEDLDKTESSIPLHAQYFNSGIGQTRRTLENLAERASEQPAHWHALEAPATKADKWVLGKAQLSATNFQSTLM
jgi:hypothetical protein